MTLCKGAHYRLPDGSLVECLSVNWSYATVRPLAMKRVKYHTAEGRLIEFESRPGSFIISPNSDLDEQ